jgi:ankyrin repeat protein
MRKWTIHYFYSQYLYALWLAFLLLTSCNTGEMAPATLQADPGTIAINTLQANPAMPAIDTLQANPGIVTSDTAHYTKLLFEGIVYDDLNKVVLGRTCGAPVEALSDSGETSLTMAVATQNVEAIHYLIQQGADINQKNQKGYAPLHYAVRELGGYLDEEDILYSTMPHILCSYRADVNVQDQEGNTPLHHAINTPPHLRDAILVYRDNCSTPGEEHIQILLKAGAQLLPNNNGATPISIAESIDRSNIIGLLRRAELERAEKEGIIQSTISKENLISYLLSPSNEDQKQMILCEHLCSNFLEKDNIHINTNFSRGNKLIHLATRARNLSMIQFLMQFERSQINYTNFIDQTPLHIAAENGHTEIVLYLAKCPNISLNALSEGGYSPLHYALIHGHNHVIGCLARSRANINIKNSDGKTCIHYAAYNGSLSAVRYLLHNGANINAVDNDDDTPLDIAIENGQSDIVIEYLIRQGAVGHEQSNDSIEGDENNERASQGGEDD